MLQNRQGPWLPALGTRTTGPGNEGEAMARSDVDGKEAERKGERGQRSAPFLKAMAARWRGTERKKKERGPDGRVRVEEGEGGSPGMVVGSSGRPAMALDHQV
jgi:hypothetical protein